MTTAELVASLSPELRLACVNTIKMLAADAVEKAKSGHPGAPMGCADIAFVLWSEFLRYDADAPRWQNRDRFILSNGHGSMLLYAMLHLSGFDLSLDELKNFRQWGSKTPGHPEFGHTVGVEVTTGPLGQGIAHAVGMAMAAEMAAARFNTDSFKPIDQYIYGICGDGDLMEGVASEAASLAGHQKLGRLIFFYDDNEISIDGDTDISFTEDVPKRFEAYGWHVQRIDGHDHAQISQAVKAAQAVTDKPSLIVAKTIIGNGSPNKQGKEISHGAPLGAEEIKLTKESIGWPVEPTFYIPAEVSAFYAQLKGAKQADHKAWAEGFAAWAKANPEKAKLWQVHFDHLVPADLDEQLVAVIAGKKDATRVLSNQVLNRAAELVPQLVGGSADLQGSNGTLMKNQGHFGPGGHLGERDTSRDGRNLYFGVREFAEAAAINGMTLWGGFRVYGATFLIFSDYMRPAIRLAALMGCPSIYVLTHDSFYLGEDGPTHQPVEHHEALRAIPHNYYWRPADGVETAMAWAYALMEAKGPVCMALTRQALPPVERPAGFQNRDVWKGGYVAMAGTDATIIATGSEVETALGAAKLLAEKGIALRVVSMPCVDLFEQQDKAYQDAVLGTGKIAAIEAGRTTGWYKWTGRDGLVIGLDDFGASAPAGKLAEAFGFTPAQVALRIETWLKG
ncbi:MAG TPA: transketolase [Symbiobacteriaceae bacterium]|nr:transketolase [Symbiobacteriaceae bacterium]